MKDNEKQPERRLTDRDRKITREWLDDAGVVLEPQREDSEDEEEAAA